MTVAHWLFIPGVLLIGVVIGFMLGGKMSRDALALQQRREAERAARIAARDRANAPRP